MELLNNFLWKRIHLVKRLITEWREKQKWRRYNCCKIHTDLDEVQRCPACGNSGVSEIVLLRKSKLRRLVKKGKIWTKHPMQLYFK